MMDRLERRVGFRTHAQGFRHTFATVATKLGWNFERLRAAMGHEDYQTLQRYVRLAMERDLGLIDEWMDFVAAPTPDADPKPWLDRRDEIISPVTSSPRLVLILTGSASGPPNRYCFGTPKVWASET